MTRVRPELASFRRLGIGHKAIPAKRGRVRPNMSPSLTRLARLRTASTASGLTSTKFGWDSDLEVFDQTTEVARVGQKQACTPRSCTALVVCSPTRGAGPQASQAGLSQCMDGSVGCPSGSVGCPGSKGNLRRGRAATCGPSPTGTHGGRSNARYTTALRANGMPASLWDCHALPRLALAPPRRHGAAARSCMLPESRKTAYARPTLPRLAPAPKAHSHTRTAPRSGNKCVNGWRVIGGMVGVANRATACACPATHRPRGNTQCGKQRTHHFHERATVASQTTSARLHHDTT